MYIQTQEGDVVRIQIKTRDSATASAMTEPDTSLAEFSATSWRKTKIVFSVEGDLNADELTAIRSVVEQASALAAEFFAGDAPAAFVTLQGLDVDGSQLAQVGVQLRLREQATYTATAAVSPQPAAVQADPVATESPESTAPEQPGEPVAPPAPSEDAAPTTTPDGSETAEASAADTTPVAAPSNTAANALATVAAFLRQLLDSLGGAAEPGQDSSPSVSVSLKLRIFQSTVATLALAQTAAASSPAAAEGLPLVADTLEALAAQQEPPLDARV